ncbi:MAG: hypothetical protein JNM52_03210, partial [Betaproteobacteria bacterium]|nr:hypothetical protein [Betaproteobacteria bacterium]
TQPADKRPSPLEQVILTMATLPDVQAREHQHNMPTREPVTPPMPDQAIAPAAPISAAPTVVHPNARAIVPPAAPTVQTPANAADLPLTDEEKNRLATQMAVRAAAIIAGAAALPPHPGHPAHAAHQTAPAGEEEHIPHATSEADLEGNTKAYLPDSADTIDAMAEFIQMLEEGLTPPDDTPTQDPHG